MKINMFSLTLFWIGMLVATIGYVRFSLFASQKSKNYGKDEAM
jgi:hypothetical protein